ncbi:MAG TPA: serine hydrolase [Ktedonobacterales bacterium]
MSELEDEVAAILAPLGGRTAVAARRAGRPAARPLPVAGTEERDNHNSRTTGAPPMDVALRADEVFPAASLAKIPIAIELMRRVDMGQFELDERMDTAAVPRAGGGGVLDYLDPATRLSLAELCTLMLIVSDNTASNVLLDLVGMGEVNETLNRLNLPHTRLARHFMDAEARRARRENLTTAADMLALMELIRGNALPGGRRLRETLAAQQSFSEFIEGWLPAGATLAHKDGTLEGVIHDTGILSGPNGAGVYCVLTSDQDEIPTARAAIGRIVRTLWNGWRLG